MLTLRRAALVLFLWTAAACDNKEKGNSASAGSGSTHPAAGEPAVVTQVRKTAACMHAKGCEFAKPQAELFKMELTKDNIGPLLALLEDPDEVVQGHAMMKLTHGNSWFGLIEKPQAEFLMKLAEKMPSTFPKSMSEGVASGVGNILGESDLEFYGLMGRAKALVEKSDAPEKLRGALVNFLLKGNPKSDAAYEVTLRQARSGATAALRGSALLGLVAAYVGSKRPAEDICKAWLEALPGVNDSDGGRIAEFLTAERLVLDEYCTFNCGGTAPHTYLFSDENRCSPETWRAAYDAIAKRVASGAVEQESWVEALSGGLPKTYQVRKSTREEKELSLSALKATVEASGAKAKLRGAALRLLVDAAPSEAKPLVEKYTGANDPPELHKEAMSLGERLKKKLAEVPDAGHD